MEAAASIAAVTDIRSLCRILNMPLPEKPETKQLRFIKLCFLLFWISVVRRLPEYPDRGEL